jgi:hypothetical protein
MNQPAKAANFAQIRTNLGSDFEINAQVADVGQTEFNKNGNKFQTCILWDGQEQQKCKIYEGRTNTPLNTTHKGQWLTFSLSGREFKDTVYVGGFWSMDAPVISKPVAVPNAPDAKTEWNEKERDKNECICRQCAGKAAAEVVAAMITKSGNFSKQAAINDLLEISDILAQWFIAGNVPAEPTENDIPF